MRTAARPSSSQGASTLEVKSAYRWRRWGLFLSLSILLLAGCGKFDRQSSGKAPSAPPRSADVTIVGTPSSSPDARRVIGTTERLYGDSLSRIMLGPRSLGTGPKARALRVEVTRGADWRRSCFALLDELLVISPDYDELQASVYYPAADGTGNQLGLIYRPKQRLLTRTRSQLPRPTWEEGGVAKFEPWVKVARRDVHGIAVGTSSIPWTSW